MNVSNFPGCIESSTIRLIHDLIEIILNEKGLLIDNRYGGVHNLTYNNFKMTNVEKILLVSDNSERKINSVIKLLWNYNGNQLVSCISEEFVKINNLFTELKDSNKFWYIKNWLSFRIQNHSRQKEYFLQNSMHFQLRRLKNRVETGDSIKQLSEIESCLFKIKQMLTV